jgi:hypothetical protein
MSYSNATATSPINIVQQLVTWLVSVGWTSDLSAAEGSGWRAHLHKSGLYVHLRAIMNETVPGLTSPGTGIGVYLSTSFSSGSSWGTQPGSPPYQNGSSTAVVWAGAQLLIGSVPNMYFFADATGDNIVVVIEKTTGIFGHFGWGPSLVKNGTWTGGAYFFGSIAGIGMYYTFGSYPGLNLTSLCPGADGDTFGGASASFVRADVDAFTGKWIGMSSNVNATYGYTGKIGESSVLGGVVPTNSIARYAALSVSYYPNANQLQARTTSVLHAEANFLPVLMWVKRDAAGYSLLGSLPFIYQTNGVGNGFVAASVYPFGADNYMMFPNFAVKKV